MNCSHCGQPTRYIQQYGQWWCDACQQYTRGPAPAGTPAAAAASAPAQKSGIGGKLLKILGGVFLAIIGLGIAGYFLNQKKAEVSVQCNGVDGGVECTAEHTSGGAKATACFDITIDCEDGTKATAHDCITVEPEAKSTDMVLPAEFSNADTCSPVAGSLALENLKVSEAD